MPAVRRLPAGRKRSGSRRSRATREPRLVNPVALRVRPRAQRADEPGPHVAPRFGFPPSPHSTPPPPLCPQAATRGTIVGPDPAGQVVRRHSTRRRVRRVAGDGRSLATPQDIAGSSMVRATNSPLVVVPTRRARSSGGVICEVPTRRARSSGGTRPVDVAGGSLVMVGRLRPRRTSRGRPWCARQQPSGRSRPGGPGRPAALDPSTWSAGRPVMDGRSLATPQDIAGSSKVRATNSPLGGPDPASRVVRRSSTLGRVAGLPTRTAEPTRAAGSFETAPIRVVPEPVGHHERVWYVRPSGRSA